MSADENVEKKEAAEESSPAISKKGWFIVVAVVVLEAVFFCVILFVGKTDAAKDGSGTGKKAVLEDAAYLNKYSIKYEGLNYSIMTTSSNMATLSMNLDIILGLTEDERDSDSDKPSAEVMEAFKRAVEALEPDIKDFMQNVIDNMTIQRLQKPEGKESIKTQIKNYINGRLERISFGEAIPEEWSRSRVRFVRITQFILQR
jgi:flagellar basal body-associated protein FliL